MFGTSVFRLACVFLKIGSKLEGDDHFHLVLALNFWISSLGNEVSKHFLKKNGFNSAMLHHEVHISMFCLSGSLYEYHVNYIKKKLYNLLIRLASLFLKIGVLTIGGED